ncbi:hypothetical protein [Ktedonobacter racemifer]|uniref:DUF4179 domain-containing protein n=1 Tax=Ktedonobacter racemifer DSM 44963 TaxID=485913 RepID=D6TQQ7_KTERA|nr:hypothetical protein [Ktedonobacter racemifer]EFH87724.1 hypothetical protein Krac_9070 [Ktedonobacter racemifer DSM 44963]
MSKQQQLMQTYNDLLETAADQKLMHVVEELDNLGNTPPVPNNVNWQNLRMRYVQHSFQKPTVVPFREQTRSWWFALTRKAILVPLIAALLIVTTASAFAATPLLQSLLQGGSYNTKDAIQYSTFGDIQLSQKVGNATVRLEKGYAEDHNIVLGVTATPVNDSAMLNNPHLTTANGTDLSSSGQLLGDIENHILAQSMTFSDANVVGTPASLNLTLKMDLVQNGSTQTVTFHFQLPYHQGEVVAPHQQAISQSQTITLEKATIGKTQTTIEFSGLNEISVKSAAGKPVTPQIDMQTSNTNHITTFDYAGNNESGKFVFRFNSDLSHYHGPWTIIVTKGNTYKWIFHLNV